MQKVKKGYDKNYKTVKNGIVCLKKKYEKRHKKNIKTHTLHLSLPIFQLKD